MNRYLICHRPARVVRWEWFDDLAEALARLDSLRRAGASQLAMFDAEVIHDGTSA